MMHRARRALVIDRTGWICRVRAFAGEYGMVFPTGVAKFRKGVANWLANEGNGLSGGAVTTLRELLTQLDDKEARVSEYDAFAGTTGRRSACLGFVSQIDYGSKLPHSLRWRFVRCVNRCASLAPFGFA